MNEATWIEKMRAVEGTLYHAPEEQARYVH